MGCLSSKPAVEPSKADQHYDHPAQQGPTGPYPPDNTYYSQYDPTPQQPYPPGYNPSPNAYLPQPGTNGSSTFLNTTTGSGSFTNSATHLGGRALFVMSLDFGTTFSGFAFASHKDPGGIFICQEWPGQNEGLGRPYCKTSTSLLYERLPDGRYELLEWGWPARVAFTTQKLKKRSTAELYLVERFKLHLADDTDAANAVPLPPGLTARRAIVDFVSRIGQFALDRMVMRNGHLDKDQVQWCLTVPSQWSDRAKQDMKDIALEAGLVTPSSPYQVMIILEPEAASIYSQRKLLEENRVNMHDWGGEEFLVVDAGGGTVDLVVHKVDPVTKKIKELASSEGGLCGSSYVDGAFLKYMMRQYPCFHDFMQKNPDETFQLKKQFELLKVSVGITATDGVVWLPRKLGDAIKADDDEADPDRMWLDENAIKAIFDPTVDKILELIADRLRRVQTVKKILMVGGFSGSEYLLSKVKDRFGRYVGGQQNILCPIEPGAAVVQGAVLYGLDADVFSSRVSRLTYGLKSTRVWQEGDWPDFRFYDPTEGCYRCLNVFETFVRAGEEVPSNSSISRSFAAVDGNARHIEFTLVCTPDPNPRYTTDPGVEVASKCVVQLAEAGASYQVHMYFGKTTIEVMAVPFNATGGEVGRLQSVPLQQAD